MCRIIMIGTLILLICLPYISICGYCHYKINWIECVGVDEDEFLNELFKIKQNFQGKIISKISISDSKFYNIRKFPNLYNLFTIRPEAIALNNCSVANISNNAFGWAYFLKVLDLSNNELQNVDFVLGLPSSVYQLDVSKNAITEINLDYFTRYEVLNFSRNELYSILPEKSNYGPYKYKKIDLSFNKLRNFSDIVLQRRVFMLNLSFNSLSSIELFKSISIVDIRGNNISLFNVKNGIQINSIFLSFIPKTQIYFKELFSLTNTYIGFLNEENSLNVSRFSRGIIDFSNIYLKNISENYFRKVWLDEINLSHNDLYVLNKSLFSESTIANINLSYCQLKNITSQVFANLGSLKNLTLKGNLLENFTDLCNTLSEVNLMDLSANSISWINSSEFKLCRNLEHLNLSRNNLSSLEFKSSLIKTLDISLNNLISIGADDFSLLAKIVKLDINNNKVSIVKQNSFRNLNELKSIDLSNNFIELIEDLAFFNLPKIEVINLANNKLRFLGSSIFKNLSVLSLNFAGNDIRYIKSKAFDSLYNLKLLNFSNAAISTLEKDFIFNLPKIEILDLTNNKLFILDNYTFTNLNNIHFLYFGGNKIEKMESYAFNNINKLQNLNFSGSGLNEIRPFAFSNLFNLKFIDLRFNNLSGLAKNVLNNVSINNLYLNRISGRIYLDETIGIKNLTVQFEGNLEKKTVSNINLENLFVVNSDIKIMKNDCFFGNFYLKTLDFTNSTIQDVEPRALSSLFSLTKIEASPMFQNVKVIKNGMFEDLNSLQTLRVSHTSVTTIEDEGLKGLSQLKELYLNDNSISIFNDSVFASLNYTLKILDLSGNNLNNINLDILCGSLSNLKILNISNSTVGQLLISEKYLKAHSVEELDLSYNKLNFINNQTFRLFVNLKKLLLNNNQGFTVNILTFLNTKNLEVLRLDNQYLSINTGALEGLENLKVLNLSQTNIFRYEFAKSMAFLKSLKNLKEIYIDRTIQSNYNFDYTIFHNVLRNLQRISINNHSWDCSILLKILAYFDDLNINYDPSYPRFNTTNINGITCT